MKSENKIFIHDKELHSALRRVIGIVMFFINYLYHIALMLHRLFRKAPLRQKKYKVAVCAIFKNEGLAFKEWIEYHLLVGVDHFYLYNNQSTDHFREILQPYIEKGIVDLIEWDYPAPCQFTAYEDAFTRFRDQSQWITFIDLDEFICPFHETSLGEWVDKYIHYPSVVIYWKMFGTSGLLEHDSDKLVVEQYTVCWDKYYDIGKCMFNTDFEIANYSLHHVYPARIDIGGVKLTLPPINEFKQFVKFKSNRIGLFNNENDFTIQINHYSSKAYVNCIKEKFISRGDVNNHPRNAYTFFWHENKNKSTDYKIWRFIIELKVRMGKVKDQSIVDFTHSNRS